MQAAAVPGGLVVPQALPSIVAAIPPSSKKIPAFVAMPNSANKITDRISQSSSLEDTLNELPKDDINQV